MRLEIGNGSNGKIYIISPACDHRIPCQNFVVITLEEFQEFITHGGQVILFFHQRLLDEAVIHTWRVVTCFLVSIQGPEWYAAATADTSLKAVVFKELQLVFSFHHSNH